MSLKRSASVAGLLEEEAPCCWLCLEEGPDASDKPLCRDCSCRGTSGFVHLSCAVKYAENMSRDDADEEYRYPSAFFRTCPNCKQDYQGDVAYTLAKARVDFVEREFKNNHEMCLDAMTENLYALDFKDEQRRSEWEDICSKMISIIEIVDKDPSLQHDGMSHSIAMAETSIGEFKQYELGTKEYLEEAKKHFIRSKDLWEGLGKVLDVRAMDRKIRTIVAKLSGTEPELDTAEEIIHWRTKYNDSIESFGENDIFTIEQGVDLATALHGADHTIEAERFLTTLAQKCRLVHGIDHKVTKETLVALQVIKVRQVYLSTGSDVFQALRYESDGERIVLQGPLPEHLDERNVDKEKTLTIDSKDARSLKGTPVVCHSLQLRSMVHLNGKIGEIRASFGEDESICLVHFEEDGLKPTKVKLENVRILFELPEKK